MGGFRNFHIDHAMLVTYSNFGKFYISFLRISLSINALRACVYIIYIQQPSSFRAPHIVVYQSNCHYLPYSIHLLSLSQFFREKRGKTRKIKPEKYSMLTLLRLKVNKQTFPLCSERCSIVTLPKLPYEGASPISIQENCFANGRPVNCSFCVNSLSPTDVSALNNPDSSLQNKDVAHE